jgi:hypothetical protein
MGHASRHRSGHLGREGLPSRPGGRSRRRLPPRSMCRTRSRARVSRIARPGGRRPRKAVRALDPGAARARCAPSACRARCTGPSCSTRTGRCAPSSCGTTRAPPPNAPTCSRPSPLVGDIAGAPPMAGFTAPKLLWLSRHEPASHARIASVLLPKDYLGFRLHGQLVTDPSDAAGTSWFDERARAGPTVSAGQRDRSTGCRKCATEPRWRAELLPGPAEELGLPAGIPVATGGGDAAAGAVGIGAVSGGDAFISLGTSGQLFVTTSSYRPTSPAASTPMPIPCPVTGSRWRRC